MWIVLSLSAGIAEELVWRGVLPALLSSLTGSVPVALALSVVLMALLHMVQKAEELLIIDSQAYCQEHLLLRLYDPEPEPVYGNDA